MTQTWIVVAHRAGARVFESAGPAHRWRLVESIDHPEGRLRPREIDTDSPGQQRSRRGIGINGLRPMERAHNAAETVTDRFANRLCADLDRGRSEGRYDRLVLVAPPDLLGRLRSSLSPPTESMVAGALPKDFHMSKPDEIRRRLEDAALV